MRLLLLTLLMGLLLTPAAAADKTKPKPRISLELVTEKGFPIDGAHKWNQLFADLGVSNIQIRSATARDEVAIEKRGTDAAPSYQVIGRISATNVLQVPGGKFTINDSAQIKAWLETLDDQGAEGVTQQRSAFGLTTSQLQELNGDLTGVITADTTNMPASDALDKIARKLKFRLSYDPGAEQALAKVTVEENLSGLSGGTALAAVLRPAGLVMVPERPRGGTLQYRIGKPAAGHESWPVGWKPENQERKLVPKLYELANVEIAPLPLNEALEAIQERLKIPFLWDHNALALYDIHPDKIEVSLPAKKLSYSLILGRLLSQAKLKKELRVDDAGHPFLWITSIKSEMGGARK